MTFDLLFLFNQTIRDDSGLGPPNASKDLWGLLMQNFYRLDALPVPNPTVSKHWRNYVNVRQGWKLCMNLEARSQEFQDIVRQKLGILVQVAIH